MIQAEPSGQPNLVLAVDDDPTMRLMLESTLARLGLRVLAAADGTSALALFAEQQPDLVLLDIGLPDIDGLAACAAMRRLPGGRDTPIMMLTGQDDAESVAQSYAAGATDFVAKPINWEILGHRVRFVLRAAGAFADVQRSRKRLADAQRIAQLGSWEWDIATDEVRWSDEMWRLFALEPRSVRPTLQLVLDHALPAERDHLRQTFVDALKSSGARAVEQAIVRADGQRRVVQVVGEARHDDRGRAVGISGTIQDVTERRAAEERIRFLAYHDSLTRLPNRAWLREELARAIAASSRRARPLAVMFLDLDHFKRINDTLGHAIGDQILCAVGERLRTCLRQGDGLARAVADASLARLGGDEFCIVMTELEHPELAATVARRVLDALAAPFRLAEHELVVGASIGIALHPLDARDADDLLQAADTAMYYTKSEGRNGYSYYNASMNARAVERLAIEGALRHALERDELVVHYQPIVALAGGRIAGFEALVRWQHPERGLLMPGQFIQVAEDSSLIVPIGERVLELACAQLARWEVQGLPGATVAVNLSGEHFRRADLVDKVRAVLDRTGIRAQQLKLEITESVLLRQLDQTLDNLARLRALGVRLSIDDFGTGYSSLSYLKSLPVDELKIDRSFIHDLGEGGRDAAIVAAVVQLARAVGMDVVAEGVESADQLAQLERLGCPKAQGYYFSRPQPVEAIARLLSAGSASPRLPVDPAVEPA